LMLATALNLYELDNDLFYLTFLSDFSKNIANLLVINDYI